MPFALNINTFYECMLHKATGTRGWSLYGTFYFIVNNLLKLPMQCHAYEENANSFFLLKKNINHDANVGLKTKQKGKIILF